MCFKKFKILQLSCEGRIEWNLGPKNTVLKRSIKNNYLIFSNSSPFQKRSKSSVKKREPFASL